MKCTPIEPPRVFAVGHNGEIHLKDCGRVELGADEQITFVTPSGTEFDVARKSWGYYATPSLNHRLPQFGLKPALVRSGDRFFLLLVEKDNEEEFHAYLKAQRMEIVEWLDESMTVDGGPQTVVGRRSSVCSLCGSREFAMIFRYDSPPEGETRFPICASTGYHREIHRCRRCGHYLNLHQMNLARLYEGAYVDATYGAAGMRRSYERIMALSPEKSDNCQRVTRILDFMAEQFKIQNSKFKILSVLDVGSGLCVFLKRMKDAGWSCTALDPDSEAAKHACSAAGVEAVCGDFMDATRLGRFDLVAFNKVLEHVPDPVAMLRKSREHLKSGGVVYVEVPDGEAAAADGPGREEFFIEHLCVFSFTSLSLLAQRAGFTARLVERVREPSGKYTLRAFLQ